jgi:hypothetical protein
VANGINGGWRATALALLAALIATLGVAGGWMSKPVPVDSYREERLLVRNELTRLSLALEAVTGQMQAIVREQERFNGRLEEVLRRQGNSAPAR